MKHFQIKSWINGRILFEGKFDSLKLCAEAAVKAGVSLDGASLDGASLDGASLDGASLYRASLNMASLNTASLNMASLDGASLNTASLNMASLNMASLNMASLNMASLDGASLNRASLDGAKIVFRKFPSIRILSSINLGELPSGIALELMRRDAASHPHPERFSEWADGGSCPYQNEDYFWIFNQDRKVWKPGKPEMSDVDLIKAICTAKGWKISGYLE